MTRIPNELPIGEILVLEKLITGQQLQEALAKQKEELSYPLGKILVDMRFISPADLKKAIDIIGPNGKIGNYLIENRFITKKQLETALKKQETEEALLGKILLELGYITQDKLVQALIQQANKPKLGEWLVSKGLLSPTNLKVALRFQSRGRRIGDILVEFGYISRAKLNEVIENYNKRESLESILINEGFVTKKQLDKIKADPDYNDHNMTDILLAKGIVDEVHIAQAEAIRYEVPYQQFDKVIYSEKDRKALSSFIGAAYARKHYIVPAFVDQNSVILAITTPKALEQVRDVSQLHKKHAFSVCFTTFKDFERIYSQIYGRESYLSLRQSSTIELVYENANEDRLRQLENLKQPEAVRIVNLLIEKGLEMGATDIHIENDAWGTQIRYRIDGMLRHMDDPDLVAAVSDNVLSVISRLKVISGMDLAERRIPQDGAFRMMYMNRQANESYPVDFRVSTVKGYGLAENVAIRILDPQKADLSLDELNYSPGDLKIIKRLLGSPSGLFLLTGPTGCGKTTTLYACLKYLNSSRVKIMTSENPVEYVVPGITQVNTNPKIGLTHAKNLRSFLRQDPDVILVGEIRDEETAEVAIKAAETGHLILSTLHTSDPISAVLRLMDLNISAESLASTLLGIISQRLLKVNCPNCAEEYFPSEDEWAPFYKEYPLGKHFYRSTGCPHCEYIGFKGRKPVYEFLVVDRDIQRLLRTNADMFQIREEALRNGMVSMVEHAIGQPRDFTLSEIYNMDPYNIVEEFKTSSIIKERIKS